MLKKKSTKKSDLLMIYYKPLSLETGEYVYKQIDKQKHQPLL